MEPQEKEYWNDLTYMMVRLKNCKRIWAAMMRGDCGPSPDFEVLPNGQHLQTLFEADQLLPPPMTMKEYKETFSAKAEMEVMREEKVALYKQKGIEEFLFNSKYRMNDVIRMPDGPRTYASPLSSGLYVTRYWNKHLVQPLLKKFHEGQIDLSTDDDWLNAPTRIREKPSWWSHVAGTYRDNDKYYKQWRQQSKF